MKAIERGILERFRHHRTGELLNLECKPAVARNAVTCATLGNEVERQRVAQEIENPEVRSEPFGASIGERTFDDRTVLPARTSRGDVGAIDREMQNERLERSTQPLGGIVACGVVAGGDPCEQPRQYGEFARENVGTHATFGFDEDGIKTAFIAAHVVPGSRQYGEPAIVEKEP